jgi:hypothetical protein
MNDLAARKRALVERSALSRTHLRREIRLMRASVAESRGARLGKWMRRGLAAARVSMAVFGFLAAVRKGTGASRKRNA